MVISVILASLLAALTWYSATASAGSTFAHKSSAGVFTAVSLALMVVSAAVALAYWRRATHHRGYALLIAFMSAVMLVGSSYYPARQETRVVRTLESAYHSIAAAGAPFPDENEVRKRYFRALPESYSSGYWVAPDRQSFELYYHDSSDSYTMRYPEGSWEWRGNDYAGPEELRE
jgi:hypothetical protein